MTLVESISYSPMGRFYITIYFQCVEVARLPDGNVAIRDSKNRAAAEVLIFSAREWASFVCAVKSKEFDA
jgi:hypothetical protein